MTKKSKTTSSKDESLTDWVAALAQTAETTALPSKAERVAKRQAKRQQKQQERMQRKKRKQQQQQESKPGALLRRNEQSLLLQQQQRRLAQFKADWEALVARYSSSTQQERRRYSKIIETSDRKPRNYPHTVQHKKKGGTWLEPRKSDYGGLGLARPTLYLSFTDPSWAPRLEQEFAEHIPGWSGKPPMAQAMKKQRDANLLWRRLQREKSKNGKKMKRLTPDQRIEALLQSSELV